MEYMESTWTPCGVYIDLILFFSFSKSKCPSSMLSGHLFKNLYVFEAHHFLIIVIFIINNINTYRACTANNMWKNKNNKIK